MPTPEFLRVVGISSAVHIHSIEKEAETQKLGSRVKRRNSRRKRWENVMHDLEE